MVVKKLLFLVIALMSICNVSGQSIEQVGIAYRYNGKKQRTPVSGVYVKVASSTNGVVSQENNGQFVLKLRGINMGDPMGYATVTKQGMMVFNKEEVDRWSVQKKPLVLIVCDANVFQKQKEQLIAIGRNQAEKKYRQKLSALEKQNKAQQLTIDEYYSKLDSIDQERKNAFKHMDEYAEMFARIDESKIDTLAQKAMDLFRQGNIDEAVAVFKKENPVAKIAKSMRVKEQAGDLRKIAERADSLAQKDIETNLQNAKAYIAALKIKNEWDEAGRLLKELADTMGTLDAIGDYADFALSQNQYIEAEPYLLLYKSKIEKYCKHNSLLYGGKLSACYNLLSVLYIKTHRYIESERIVKAYLDMRKSLLKDLPHVYDIEIANSCNNLGFVYQKKALFTKSEQMYKLALKICKTMISSYSTKYEPHLASVYHNLGSLYEKTNCYEDSEQMYKLSLEIIKRLVIVSPQLYEPELADIYNGLGVLYFATQRYIESEQMYKLALDINKRLSDFNPQAYEPTLATIYNNLGNLYSTIQQYKESELNFKFALDIVKRLSKFNPQTYEPTLATIYNNLGNLYSATQQDIESEQMHILGLNIVKRLARINPRVYNRDLAKVYSNLGALYSANQRYTESVKVLNLALEIAKRYADANPQVYDSDLAKIYSNLGNLYSNTRQFSESEKMYKLALEIRMRLAEVNPQVNEPVLIENYCCLATLYRENQRYSDAESLLKIVAEKYERLSKTNPFFNIKSTAILLKIAEVKIQQKKYLEAINDLEKALVFYKKKAELESFFEAYTTTIETLHLLYVQQGCYLRAYQQIKSNISLLSKIYNSDKEKYANLFKGILISMSAYSMFMRQFDEAKGYLVDASNVVSNEYIDYLYANLAAVYLILGEYNNAEKIYRQYKTEFKELFLNNIDELVKKRVVPRARMADVEKIKRLLEE